MGPGKRLFLSAMLVALTIAGCGGGGESTSASSVETVKEPAPLSKQQQVSQSAVICSAMNAALGPLVFGDAGGEDRVRQIAVLYRRMAEMLEVIEHPRDDATGYAEFMEAAARLKKEEGDLVRVAARGEAEALAAAEDKASSALRAFRAASAVWGAPQCAGGPDPPYGSQAGA
jgi:hypothetical protein